MRPGDPNSILTQVGRVYLLFVVEETYTVKPSLEKKYLNFPKTVFDVLLWQLASGEVFGPDQPIALKLLGSERSFQALEGMAHN